MPRPKLTVDPIFTWLDERGYNLSDRIWNISEATSAQIDALLNEAISSGMQSTTLAKRLEQFLLPGRHLPQTTTPYGTTGSYNARRLARTEITRANSMATKAASIANSFVERMYYNLSNSHVADGDICEEYAAISDANDGYDPASCPVPGADSHPNCMCYLTSKVKSIEDAAAMIRETVDLPADISQWMTEDMRRMLALQILGLAVF